MLVLLIAFVVGFFIAVPTMGPASAIIIRHVVGERYREGFAFAAGSVLAEGLACLAAIWGVELAFYTIPNLRTILEWGGTFILLAVGAYFALTGGPSDTDNEVVPQPSVASLGGQSLGGFAVTAFNPTLIATWTTLFGIGISVLDVQLATWQKWLFPVAVMLGEFAWFTTLVLLAKRFGAYLDETVVGWIIRGIGGLLFALGAWGIVQKILGAW